MKLSYDSPNVDAIHRALESEPVNPHPISEIGTKSEYPIEALGTILGNAASAIAKGVQAPVEIAAHSALAAAALAAQDKVDVLIDGRRSPISLFLLTIAESGDRKSACDKVASAPLEKWQRENIKEHRERLQEYINDLAVYESEHKSALSGKKTSSEKAKLLSNIVPPEPPPEPTIISQDPTLEGLQKSFRLGLPSQALLNDEGAQFFGGHSMNKENMMKTIAGLSKYWDGAPIVRTRAALGESVTMFDRRLSIHLQVQPVIASDVLGNRLLMDQGWLARFLIAECRTLAGTRLYESINVLEHPAVMEFHKRITELLGFTPEIADGGGLILPTISLNDDAKSHWVEVYNVVERELKSGGLFELVKPTASKAAENALRIASIFAVVENTDEITLDQASRGWIIARYYLNTTLRFTQLSDASLLERDAIAVSEWIKEKSNGSAKIEDMQKRLTPKRCRKSVAQIRTIMAALAQAQKAEVIDKNTRGEASAWRITA